MSRHWMSFKRCNLKNLIFERLMSYNSSSKKIDQIKASTFYEIRRKVDRRRYSTNNFNQKYRKARTVNDVMLQIELLGDLWFLPKQITVKGAFQCRGITITIGQNACSVRPIKFLSTNATARWNDSRINCFFKVFA